MSGELTYDSVEIGQELPSITYEMTPDNVRWYLEEAGETNPVYSDPELAKNAGLGGPVTPPMIACMYAGPPEIFGALGLVFPAHTIHASSEYTFVNPVRPGDIITSKGKIHDKYIKKGRKFVVTKIESFNQNGAPVLVNIHTAVWPK